MAPLVSVILPTYNRADLLCEAIDSALGQSYPELETVVIDDGSTDGTRELVLKRYGNDDRVRYQHQANAGVSAARNTATKLARGELIAFIDSDDTWKPWKIELQVRCLELAPEAGMVWTDMQAIGPDGEEISPSFLTEYYRSYRYFTRETLFSRSMSLCEPSGNLPHEAAGRNLYVGDIFSEMIMGNLVHTPTAIMRRERLEKVGGFNEALRRGGEDFDFWLRTCREGPVAYADVSSIGYRIGRADNLSGPVNNVQYAESYLATIEHALKRDRARITLAPEMIAAARASGHAWLGRGLLMSGSPTSARPHMRRALRLRPWQPSTLVLLPLAYAPPAIGGPLIRAMSAAKQRLHHTRH